MLNMVSPINVSFKGTFQETFNETPSLNKKYTTLENKAKTITVLGSSKTRDSILDSMDLCSKVTKDLVLSGNNILTGCGLGGIMGSAYNAAKENSVIDIKTGKPSQNLVILAQPEWHTEDIENCTIIGKANTEAGRIEKFGKTSDTYLIFPGSSTTMQEAVSLIQKNEHPSNNEPLKKDFFAGLKKQYQILDEAKLLAHKPDELFKVVDTEGEILNELA